MGIAKVGHSKKLPQKVRKLGEKIVKIVLYTGKAVGHGKYYAAEIDGQLVEDATGRPVPYRSCGELVWSLPASK